MNEQLHNQDYYKKRLKEIGVPIGEAAKHGLSVDKKGNIKQYVRTATGDKIRYIPKEVSHKKNSKGKRVKKDRPQFVDVPLFITRLHPKEREERQKQLNEYITQGRTFKNKEIGKYLFPAKWVTGLEVKPMFTNSAIKAYKEDVKGGAAIGTEGYFKAVKLSQCGVESIAFTGITTFKVDDSLKDYLLKRELNYFTILYDGDAIDLSSKESDVIDSKRVLDFYNSAKRFSSQFYNFCRINGLKTKLYFCMVNKDLPFKGVDDLLFNMDSDKEEILEELNGLKTGGYFSFLSLNCRDNEKRLKKFFHITNHVDFYNTHAETIKDKPFLFAGFKYQIDKTRYSYNGIIKTVGIFGDTEYITTKIGVKSSLYFKTLFNPFHVDIEEEVLDVKKYLAEKKRELYKLIKNNSKLSIEGITGIGKTAFWLGYFNDKKYIKGYFNDSDQYGVIAVPTVNLVKQLVKKYKRHGVIGLSGFVSGTTQMKAINTKVIVCTYDTLHKVTDLWRRILIVDESHNLVNQWGEVGKKIKFRASVLNQVVESFDSVKKTILISATPNKLFAKKLGFKYVRIERKENNIIKVRSIESDTNSYQSLTASTLAELEKLDFSSDKIHFVYYNSKKHLERIKNHLVNSDILKSEDIEMIDRDSLDDEHKDNRVYKQIISREKVIGVKLVLCTCLIAEGININNTNIGNVYTVGVYCMDSFRQFVARFREMTEIQVFDIKRPEKWIKKGFNSNCEEEHNYLTETAELQLKYSALQNHNDFNQDYFYKSDGIEKEERIVPYIEDIESSIYSYESRLMNFTYTDGENVKIDKLRIFAQIKERETNSCNNAYFYTQISKYKNIRIEGLEEIKHERQQEIKDSLQDLAAKENEVKDSIVCGLKNDLVENGSIVVQAYLIAAMKSKNRHAMRKIKARSHNLILEEEQLEATNYYNKNKENFKKDFFVKLINAYIKLRFLNIDNEVLKVEIYDYSERHFNRRWKKLKSLWEFSIYEKRHLRKYLDKVHKTDIKARVRLKELIDSKLTDSNTISSKDLYPLVRDFFSVKKPILDKKGKSNVSRIVILSDYKIDTLLSELYNVSGSLMAGYKEFVLDTLEVNISPNKPNIEKAFIDAFLYEKLHSCNSAILPKKLASTG